MRRQPNRLRAVRERHVEISRERRFRKRWSVLTFDYTPSAIEDFAALFLPLPDWGDGPTL